MRYYCSCFSYMWRGINYALCSRTSFTWVRKSEPFCIFQHTNSSISSGLVLRIAGIWRETSCYRDDSTDHPGNSDRKNDLGKDNTYNKEWVSKQEAILKWFEDNFLIDLVSALLYCREVKQQQQKNVTRSLVFGRARDVITSHLE